jgi:tRNA pseudouridine13 synthase
MLSYNELMPAVPPLAYGEMPLVGGALGPDVSHFIVEEIPAYEACGRGEHLYLWVEKVGLNTADVERRIAKALGVHPRDVGYAGMKDRHAITRQWFSALSKHLGEGIDLGPGAQVLASSRHENKLRTGHLRGNRFRLTLVGVPPHSLETAQKLAAAIQTQGIGNYFGAQRFGRQGRNLGQALSALAKPEDKPKKGHKAHFSQKFDASVVQAEIFNRYVTLRRAESAKLLEGEVVRLEGSSRCFIVESPEQELPRLEAGDIQLTGPMIGPKMVHPRGVAAELENAAAEALGLSESMRAALYEDAPGTRRDLLMRPTDQSVESHSEGELTLTFSLPAGGYATQILREFCRDDFWLPERGAPARGASPSTEPSATP